jgi:hypothetical protein
MQSGRQTGRRGQPRGSLLRLSALVLAPGPRGVLGMWLALLLAVTGVLARSVAASGTPSACEMATGDVVEGYMVLLASSTRQAIGEPADEPTVSVTLTTADGLVHVTLAPGATVLDSSGSTVRPDSLLPHSHLRAVGVHTGVTSVEATCLAALT